MHKIIIAGIVGGIVGFIAGSIVSKNYYDTAHDEEMEKLIRSKNDEIDKLQASMDEKIEKIKNIWTKPAETNTEETEVTEVNKFTPEPVKEPVNYSVKPMVEIISDTQYTDDDNGYGKSILYYYLKNNILATEDDSMLSVESTIGSAAVDAIMEDEGDVFVRNHVHRTDYKIIAYNVSFTSTEVDDDYDSYLD